MYGSPSSLFSAPSSPAPASSAQPPVARSPTLLMPAPSGSGVFGPPKKLPQPRPAGSGSQPKAIRKPAWLLEPKIKRFDAPNLKPGSTLPTKASLGVVKTLDTSVPSTSARRASIQTPTEAHTPMSPSIPGGSVVFGVGPNVDAQHHDDAPQSADAQTPTVQDVPRLPPASRAETEAFLSDLMPPEYVILTSFVSFTHFGCSLQNVGCNDVRLLSLKCGFVAEYILFRDGVESNQPPSAPVRKNSTLDLLK